MPGYGANNPAFHRSLLDCEFVVFVQRYLEWTLVRRQMV